MNAHKILLVDDEEHILRSLQRAFLDTDYEVKTALSGYEGLQLVKKEEFAVVVSDYRMPELNGIEFLKLVHDDSPDTTRMILTGYANMEVIIAAINEGHIYKFILKPWKGEELRLDVRKGVEYYEMKKEQLKLMETIQEQNRQLKEYSENLEEKLDEKTKEIQRVNRVLERKVQELEGKDKILQFLLEIHPLEESLEVILTEIMDIVPVNKLVVYILDQEKKILTPHFGMVRKAKKVKRITAEELQLLPILPPPTIQRTDTTVIDNSLGVTRINDHSVLIPLEKQQSLMGLLLLDNSDSQTPLQESDIKDTAGFASLAAIVINDYMIVSSASSLDSTLQDILKGL
ncbi:MAG: response regulator [Candidatus Hodarchaeales archaeon]